MTLSLSEGPAFYQKEVCNFLRVITHALPLHLYPLLRVRVYFHAGAYFIGVLPIKYGFSFIVLPSCSLVFAVTLHFSVNVTSIRLPRWVTFVILLKTVVDQAGAAAHSLLTLIGNLTIIHIDMRKTACPPIARWNRLIVIEDSLIFDLNCRNGQRLKSHHNKTMLQLPAILNTDK